MMTTIKPILFSTQMVSAILDGRKSQTRRVMKPKYSNTHFEFRTDKYGTQFVEMQNDIEGETWGKNPDGSTWHKLLGYIPIKPLYQPGDILWVREKFNDDETADVLYAADQDFVDYGCKDIDDRTIFEGDVKWRPSIFMPREAARIWLRVTDVRCERVQDILCGDMKREGCIPATVTGGQYQQWQRDYFIPLWDSINAKRGYPWASNPFVWVISFERCEKPQEVGP